MPPDVVGASVARPARSAAENTLGRTAPRVCSTLDHTSPARPLVPRVKAVHLPPVTHPPMTRQQVLDLYFMDARCKLIELAAFLDRVDRGTGDADFRLAAFRDAMRHLADGDARRAETVLLAFSDPTTEPIAKAPGKGAVGAWPGKPV